MYGIAAHLPLFRMSAIAFAFALWPSHAAEISVAVTNHSEPIVCAERDNVDLEFSGSGVGSFKITAQHPAFAATLRSARDLPDFSGCSLDDDPRAPTAAEQSAYKEERVTFWENSDFWLVGYRHASFWRPANVPMRVGDKTFEGFDLVQLWARDNARAEQIAVVYPPDGYWRIRPLAPPNLQWSSYGSSFLLGPIEVAKRPIVVLKEIAFEPATRTFVLRFSRGGTARLRVSFVSSEHIILEARLDADVSHTGPFFALRSMYTNEINADVARIGWRGVDTRGWEEASVLRFPGARVSELWAGRTAPSNHNISAPDMVVGPFMARLPPAP